MNLASDGAAIIFIPPAGAANKEASLRLPHTILFLVGDNKHGRLVAAPLKIFRQLLHSRRNVNGAVGVGLHSIILCSNAFRSGNKAEHIKFIAYINGYND